jgi:hypothetical protein
LKETVSGKLEFDSCMSSDGDNICFPTLFDSEKKLSFFDIAEKFDMKKVKITIEEIKEES